MKLKTLLSAVGSTEETTFGELCSALGDDRPEDKSEWRDLFLSIDAAENNGQIEVSRSGRQIDSLILTESGVAALKTL